MSGPEAGRIRVQEVIPVSKSRPYRSVPVKGVEVAALVQGHAGQACVVGVDVGKFELRAVLRWPDGTYQRPWRIDNPGELGVLVARLVELKAACPSLKVAMESSGTYGDALRQALGDAAVEGHRVSAKAVKDQAETFDGVPSQHDGKDAAVIAELCSRGKSVAWGIRCGNETDRQLRYWVRRLDAARRIKQVWGGKLEGSLARHWPESARLMKAGSATLSGALAGWGGPAALAADPGAAEELARLGGRYLTARKIAQLVESARTSVGVRAGPWEQAELKELAGRVLEQRRQIGLCRRELKKLAKGHAVIGAQRPAVGLVCACVLWVCLGDPRDYSSAGAYRKAMGLNLVEQSSGVFKGRLRLSKRGQRMTRQWLYFGALRWMRDPHVKPWAAAKKARDGGRGARAVVGVMRKLALAAWQTAVNGAAFDPARLFPGAGKRQAVIRGPAGGEE